MGFFKEKHRTIVEYMLIQAILFAGFVWGTWALFHSGHSIWGAVLLVAADLPFGLVLAGALFSLFRIWKEKRKK